ncbi:MAG TPA: molybdopterin dinucleotide binding domain-containing protein, partial [Actinomycetota bacterium]
HPADAAAAGILDGARAIVRTDAGSAELPARVTEAIARGAVFVPFNQPGLAANSLLSGTFVTSATVEAVDAPEESPEAEAVQEVSA